MDDIRRQVRRASRRLLLNRLVDALTWSLFAALLVALVAIAIPKIWPVSIDSRTWAILWIVGALVAGLVAGVAWAIVGQRGELDAAIEIDLRYGLKERVSSALALSPEQWDTQAGKALLEDAQRRVSRIDVRDRFRPQWSWHPLLPMVTAAIVFLVVVLVKDASRDTVAASSTQKAEVKKQVRKSVEELKKRLAERKKEAEAAGLQEADQLIAKFEKAIDELSKNDVDRKKALVKLNNLSKELSDQRKDVAASERTRDQLKQLKDIQQGPADRIANAMKNGDMKQALDELQKLSDKLRSDDLSDKEKEQLAKQLQQLQKELEKTLGAKQELADKKQQLQDRINELKKNGDLAAAGHLQKQLDRVQQQMDALDQQNPQLQRLEELASKLGQCAQSMKEGKGRQAAQQLDQLAKDLQKMQDQLESLQTLDEMMKEIADAKNAMNCKECGGEGCEACQGGAMAMDQNGLFSETPGRGMGEGHGLGDRPEEETETGGYRTRVGADPRQGEAIRTGDATGRNVAGNSRESIKKEIAGAFSEDPDPLTHQQLPRREREQTKEYFELLRKGE